VLHQNFADRLSLRSCLANFVLPQGVIAKLKINSLAHTHHVNQTTAREALFSKPAPREAGVPGERFCSRGWKVGVSAQD